MISTEEAVGILERGKLLLETYPIMGTLIILMVADIISGCMVAFSTKTVSSSVSFRGMCKKTGVLIMVGICSVIEPFTQGIPIGKIASLFYIFTECWSVVENMAMLGVPLPAVLVDTLIKVRTANKPVNLATVTQPPAAAPVSVETHFHTDSAGATVEVKGGKAASQRIVIAPEIK